MQTYIRSARRLGSVAKSSGKWIVDGSRIAIEFATSFSYGRQGPQTSSVGLILALHEGDGVVVEIIDPGDNASFVSGQCRVERHIYTELVEQRILFSED